MDKLELLIVQLRDADKIYRQCVPLEYQPLMSQAADALEQREKDAERYRFIKSARYNVKQIGTNPYPDSVGVGPVFGHEFMGDSLDAAIHAAIEREGKG